MARPISESIKECKRDQSTIEGIAAGNYPGKHLNTGFNIITDPSTITDKWKIATSQEDIPGKPLWPTPACAAADSDRTRFAAAGEWQVSIREAVNMAEGNAEKETKMILNPDWVEWLMGWPISWSSLKPLPEDNLKFWQEKVLAREWWDIDPANLETPESMPTPMAGTRNLSEEGYKKRKKIYGGEKRAIYLADHITHKIGSGIGPIPRLVPEAPDFKDRLKAIGNGQVPATLFLFWHLIMEGA